MTINQWHNRQSFIIRQGRWLAVFAALVILTSLLPAWAQADNEPIPPPVERVYNVTFQTSGQSMWASGTAPAGIDETRSIISTSWNESGSTGYIEEIAGYDFGGHIGGSTSGEIDLSVRFHDFGSGSVDVKYPVEVKLTTPGANSFKPGDTVTIDSSVTVLPGWRLSTEPPTGKMDIDGGFGLGTSAWAEVCMFDCGSFNFFPPIDGSIDGNIVSATFSNPVTITPAETFAHGIGGSYGLPVVTTTASLASDGKSLTATGSRDFVDLNIDVDKWAKYAGLPIPLGIHTPELGGAQAGYEIVDLSVNVEMNQWHKFEFKPTTEVSLQFPQAVEYTVRDQSGSIVTSGNSALVKFDAGHSVDIVYPETATDIFNVVPTFSLRNSFSNTATTTFSQDISIKALELTLVIPSITIIPEACVPEVCIYVWVPTCWYKPWEGYWEKVSCTPRVCTPEIESPEIDLGTLGPLYQEVPQSTSSTDTYLFDQDRGPWELRGFNTMAQSAFPLDPQLPPTAQIDAPSQVDEGQPATMDGSASSDPDGDELSYDWSFGDDTGATVMSIDHIYQDNGNYAVTLAVSDGHGGTDVAAHSIEVNNVAPVVDAGPDVTIDEGDTFISAGSFTDPGADTWTATVDYGDGSGVQPLTLNMDKTFELSHTYADNGAYDVTVTVTDDDGGVGSDIAVVTVNNVAPAVDAGPDVTIDEGDTFISAGSFTDPGADTWTATVDYGDGSGVQPLALNADKAFSLSYTYADNGAYDVTVTVTDDDGGVGSDIAVVTVNSVVPAVDAGPDAEGFSGQVHHLSTGFTDPGILDTHSAIVDWGDGSAPEPGVVNESGGSGTVTGSHQYFVPGDYTITVTVIDKDGGEGSDSLNRTVVRLPIMIDIKPGSDPNSINLKSKGKIPVAVFSGFYEGFSLNVSDIDWSSVEFAGALALDIGGSPEDLNGDGEMDQVFHFNTQETNLSDDSAEACLTGVTTGSIHFEGCDSVSIVPPKGKK